MAIRGLLNDSFGGLRLPPRDAPLASMLREDRPALEGDGVLQLRQGVQETTRNAVPRAGANPVKPSIN